MYRRKRMSVALLVTSFLLAAPGAMEGQLTPPAGPNDVASARYTLNDIWNRLASGIPGALRTGAFLEPAAGPETVSTKTTNEIIAVAPAADNLGGATAADVALGKTFWGLRTSGGSWGLTTGTSTGGGSTYPAPVEKTGQTQCFWFNGAWWVPDALCVMNTPANQDGKVQMGMAWPNPRFTKNGNGTVADNLTGLIWLENAGCTVFFPGDTTGVNHRDWTKAMSAANALASGDCGLTDGSTAGHWRLPNVKELQSLIDYAYYNPALSNITGTGQWQPGSPFTSVVSASYWSSSSSPNNPENAWTVGVHYGVVTSTGRINTFCVWPVRGGQ